MLTLSINHNDMVSEGTTNSVVINKYLKLLLRMANMYILSEHPQYASDIVYFY